MKIRRGVCLLFLSFCFTLSWFILIFSSHLNLTVLNEQTHIEIQKEYNVYESIEKLLNIKIQRLLLESNLHLNSEKGVITRQEVEEIIQHQTRDYIEIIKGNSNEIKKVNTNFYITRIKGMLTKEGYPIDYLNTQYRLFLNIEEILEQYLQIINSKMLLTNPNVPVLQFVITVIYTYSGYWIFLMSGSFICLMLLWKHKWKTFIIYLMSSFLVLGVMLSTIFSSFSKLLPSVYEINLGQKNTYLFAKAYYLFFNDLFVIGGQLILNTLILFAILVAISEVKVLFLRKS